MMTKRDDNVSEIESMADTLMLLSKVGKDDDEQRQQRVFACKTCNKEFSSFQALGGHRASHKKPRIDGGKAVEGFGGDQDVAARKTKTHECSICGQEFPIGQALGGHMRRHRGQIGLGVAPLRAAPVVMKKTLSSNKRVLSLDLNLSPLENDLRLMLGKVNFVM